MRRVKSAARVSAVPASVIDPHETPAGETRYWLLLTDAETEQLAQGIVSQETAARAKQLLSWKHKP